MESLPSRTCTGVLRKRLLHFRNDPIFENGSVLICEHFPCQLLDNINAESLEWFTALDLKDEEEQKDEIVNSFRKSKSKPSLVTKEGNGKGGQKGKKLQAVRGEQSYVQCNETLYHCSVFDCIRWRRKTYEESAILAITFRPLYSVFLIIEFSGSITNSINTFEYC
ncbi:unnamed protein product [Brugia pahangi]|uniref:Uncharacterized protein n=1 Tax=Brugia pahangi TaxID=6280 RepID=A0A0N4T430_BRUPA|nr:unnamed protein product [Brugia pahangi]